MELTPTVPSEVHGLAGERRLRRARWMVLGALLVIVLQIPAFAVIGLVNIVSYGQPPLWRGLAGVALAVALAFCTMWLAANRTENRGEYPDRVFWASFALLLGTVAALDLDLWTALIAAVWLSVVAASHPVWSVAAVAGVLLALPWVRVLFFTDPDWLRVLLLWTIALCFAIFVLIGNLGILRLWDLSREVVAGRKAQARLAVSEERLRIARDIHDLLGHSLSGIAVRSELAARLSGREPERAAGEMVAVQEMAREALREVRSAVSGYRDVDVCSELESVRAVLTASGIRCTVSGDPEAVPDHLRGPVAWIVREAGTNIIRHSSARRCDFAFDRGAEGLTVEIHNDGVAGGREDSRVGAGSGITGLTERVATVRGTLTASHTTAGGFLLRAAFPTPAGERDPTPGDREFERTEEGE